jgi:hypothetical protein
MTQSETQLVPMLIPFLSALVGGLVAHLLSISRDQTAKRRELTVKSKMELWKLIDEQNNAASRSIGTPNPDLKAWEEIVRDVQLLGTNEQIKLVEKIVNGVHAKEKVSLKPLLESLQKEIRRELGLNIHTPSYFWFRTRNISQPGSGTTE